MSKNTTIVCWAGHGGRDPGAMANGLVEKDLNLQMALILEEKMKAYNCNFILGRRTDVFISLAEKAKFCDDKKSDLNIDIHNNAGGGIGFESFIFSGLASGSNTERIAKTIHNQITPVYIRYDSRDRGLKRGNFYILSNTKAPAWLPEYGFLDDRTGIDPKNLKNPKFLDEIMEATAKGIAKAMNLKLKEIETPVVIPKTKTNIVNKTKSNIHQAKQWAKNRKAHQRFIDIADVYWKYGKETGINPEILYAQAAKETAFGRYGGAVTPDQNNWAGIKTRNPKGDNREDHETFFTPDDGVRAHFNHISAYVGKDPVGLPHARYHLVLTIDWAGSIKYVEELSGKWCPDIDYGKSIVEDYLNDLLDTKYEKEVEVEKPKEVIPEKPKKINYDISDAIKVLRYAVGLEKLSDEEMKRLDVNNDGKIDLGDAILIQRHVVGLSKIEVKNNLYDIEDVVKGVEHITHTKRLDKQEIKKLDYFGDGRVTPRDIIGIVKKLSK